MLTNKIFNASALMGVTKFTAQQQDYKRTTRVVQAHNS